MAQNRWKEEAKVSTDRYNRMNTGLGAFLTAAKSDSYESQPEPIKFHPAQSVKDYSQPFYCKICHVDCNSKDIKNVPKHVSLEHKLMTVKDSNEPVIGLQMI